VPGAFVLFGVVELRVYLVQHGEAKSEEEDPTKPLTEKGLADTRKMANYASSVLKLNVKKILHSGKLRARQTAEVFAEALKPEGGVSEADGLDPLADPKIWAERLEELREDLMLVGHLPHLSRLVSLLTLKSPEYEVIKFRMGGIVCLERIKPGKWMILWAVIPDMIPDQLIRE